VSLARAQRERSTAPKRYKLSPERPTVPGAQNKVSGQQGEAQGQFETDPQPILDGATRGG